MLNYPENLNEKQRQQWEKSWFNVFNTIMATIKTVLIAALVVFGFTLAGDSLDGMLTKIEPVSEQEQEERRAAANEDNFDLVENGVHVQTGLVFEDGFNTVRAACTACHSAKLVTQNRATRDGWLEMIRWMQETQGLWDLGGDETIILDYLAAYYAPEESGRRPTLDVTAIEWYELELE